MRVITKHSSTTAGQQLQLYTYSCASVLHSHCSPGAPSSALGTTPRIFECGCYRPTIPTWAPMLTADLYFGPLVPSLAYNTQ